MIPCSNYAFLLLHTKGLVTNYGEGGATITGGGGHVKFCPYEKGGVEKMLAMKGGAQKVLG